MDSRMLTGVLWLLVACGAPMATSVSPAPTATATVAATNIVLERVDLEPKEELVAENADRALVSPDGKTVIVIENGGAAWLRGKVGRGEPLARRVIAPLSAMASDGRSVLLRTAHDDTDEGLVVLRVPGFAQVFASAHAEHAHYAGAGTIIFDEVGSPMSLDVATGKARVLGPPLPDFRCAHDEVVYDAGQVVMDKACPSHHWGNVLGIDAASGHWVIADMVGDDVAERVRLVDPKTGSDRMLIAVADPGTSELAPELSPDRSILCARTSTVVGGLYRPTKIECGPIGGRLAVIATGAASDDVGFAGPHTIYASDEDHTRLIDLATGATTTLSIGSLQVFYSFVLHPDGVHLFARKNTTAIWIDLRAKTWSSLEDTGQTGGPPIFDPADARHAYLPRFQKMRYDLYDVRW